MACPTVIKQGYVPPAKSLSIHDRGRAILTSIIHTSSLILLRVAMISHQSTTVVHLRTRLGMSVSARIPDFGAPPLILRSIATDVLAFLPRAAIIWLYRPQNSCYRKVEGFHLFPLWGYSWTRSPFAWTQTLGRPVCCIWLSHTAPILTIRTTRCKNEVTWFKTCWITPHLLDFRRGFWMAHTAGS